MQLIFDKFIKPSKLTQDLIDKIERIYLQTAYGERMDMYSWSRPVGTTITVEDIYKPLYKQLEKEKQEFLDFEVSLYKERDGIEPNVEELYKELRKDELTINNKILDNEINPCYGSYVEGMENADINLKIEFIVSKGNFYVSLENDEWGGSGRKLPDNVLKNWNDMIINIYYQWLINDIPVYIPTKFRAKVKEKHAKEEVNVMERNILTEKESNIYSKLKEIYEKENRPIGPTEIGLALGQDYIKASS